MKGRRTRRVAGALVALYACLAGCDTRTDPGPPPPATHPTVASLVPSATQLLIAMGASDHLVAVSNYDRISPAGLPRVGDFQSVDWEKLSQIRPDVIVTFYGPGHTPAGFVERAAALKMRQVNVNFDRLADLYASIDTLGDACAVPAAATDEKRRIFDGLRSVRDAVSAEPPVRSLMVIDPAGRSAVGRSTFLNELLETAGGINVVESAGYVTLDREAILSLRPDVILQLLPDADSTRSAAAAGQWKTAPDLPAVKNGRVCVLTDTSILQPGPDVVRTARQFAAALHPRAFPATAPAGRATP